MRGIEITGYPLPATRSNAARRGVAVEFAYSLSDPDDSYDVTQVLQHLSEPVALREMRRVTRPGGVVAVRDAGYGAFRWRPEDPRLGHWLDLPPIMILSRAAGKDRSCRPSAMAFSTAASFSACARGPAITPGAPVTGNERDRRLRLPVTRRRAVHPRRGHLGNHDGTRRISATTCYDFSFPELWRGLADGGRRTSLSYRPPGQLRDAERQAGRTHESPDIGAVRRILPLRELLRR
ncbi:methyltransferase domain-containing protein [Amycolatopsis sp. CM201R]|uniref:class I SAM-dependent methyltransferase n=1 Tax=Amycolatopsis sp. CM201R TaxID=2761537 RepID=UPI00287B7A4F|nr:methyltransferase domain-containing protein [Amycolatopsis sp. CM201R]